MSCSEAADRPLSLFMSQYQIKQVNWMVRWTDNRKKYLLWLLLWQLKCFLSKGNGGSAG